VFFLARLFLQVLKLFKHFHCILLLWLVVLLLIAAGFFLIRAQLRYRYNFGVPGPAPHFLTGNSAEFASAPRHIVVAEMHKKFGSTFVTHIPLGLVSIVFTRDPVISHYLVKNMEDFPTRNRTGFGFAQFMPLGLLGDIQGEQWRFHRRALSPLFSDRYLRWYTQAVNEELEGLQSYIQKKVGSFVDIHNALTLFTFDVIGRVGFAARFKALGNPNHPMLRGSNDMLASVVSTRPQFLQGEVYTKGKAGRDGFDPIVNAILDRKDALEDDEAKLNMLRAMQEAVDPQTGKKLSRDEIRDEIVTLLGAGHETTANTATWALYLLSRNPEVLAKVRKEADSLQDASLGKGLFEFDQLPSFAYLKQVVFETLRLYPTVPMFPRLAVRPIELKMQDGGTLSLPKNTMIFAESNEFAPGDIRDPEVFRPERFDPASPLYDAAVDDKTKFMPFGGGGRVCLGQRFAEMEAVQMVAAVVSQFDLVPDPARPPVEYCDVTLGPKESGLWMKVTERK